MAARNNHHPDDGSIRINFRLNPQRPKERVILEFLREHAANYDASRIIKQALYEMATGRSWVSGQLFQHVGTEQPALPPQSKQDDKLLDDIVASLDDWLQQ